MKMSSNMDPSIESRVLCLLLGASWMSALWSPGVQPTVVLSVFNPPNNLFHQIVSAVSERPFPTGRIWQLWIFPTLARMKTRRWKEEPWYLWIKFFKSKTIRDLGLQRSALNCTMNLSAEEQQSVWPLAYWKRMMLFTDEIKIQQKFICILGTICKNCVISNVNDCHLSFSSKTKEHLLFTVALLPVNKVMLSGRSQHL